MFSITILQADPFSLKLRGIGCYTLRGIVESKQFNNFYLFTINVYKSPLCFTPVDVNITVLAKI